MWRFAQRLNEMSPRERGYPTAVFRTQITLFSPVCSRYARWSGVLVAQWFRALLCVVLVP
jgi:hypothetical protein